jgi:hypothetical protein
MLSETQRRTVDRAREVLGQLHGYDARDLAARIGQVEQVAAGLLELVAELAGEAPEQ